MLLYALRIAGQTAIAAHAVPCQLVFIIILASYCVEDMSVTSVGILV